MTNGLIMAERVMIYLTNTKKMGRQDAHELVREAAQEAYAKKVHFKEVLKAKKILNEKEIHELLDYATYIGSAEKIVEEAVKD